MAKYKDWDKTPEAYFLTPAERAEWKKVSTDEDAEKFIGLYFAKRGVSRSSRKSLAASRRRTTNSRWRASSGEPSP